MLLVLLGALVLGAAAVVVYARFVLDPERYARETMMNALLDAKLEELDQLNRDLARQTHRGPGPCLRYPERGSIPEGELEKLAEEVTANGLADDLHLLFGQFRQWEAEAEQGMHELGQAEETLDALRERMDFWNRLIYALARDRVTRAAMDLAATQEAELRKRAQAVMAAYPPERSAQVRALWERCPQCLALPAIVRLLDQVKRVVTRTRLDRLTARLLVWAKREGDFPEDIRSLNPTDADDTPDADSIDGWQREFEYERIAGGVRVTSLGSDLTRGGEGADADQVREVLLPRINPETSAGTTGEKRCAAPVKRVEISRAEASAMLQAEQEKFHSSRVVPAFEEGQPIGFKVYRVQPGSLAYRLGLRDNDIVLAVLGERLGSPDKALQVYERVKTASRVEVEIQRCGNPYLIDVIVR